MWKNCYNNKENIEKNRKYSSKESEGAKKGIMVARKR